jgi:transcriptional regulator with XRE-family HTH domain
MDREWFERRCVELGLTQDDLSAAIGLDRSGVSRILSGARLLRLPECEKWALLLDVRPIEVVRHAYPWKEPLTDGSSPSVDLEKLRLAHEIADARLGSSSDRAQVFLDTVGVIYRSLPDTPIDERTRQALIRSIRQGFRPTR